MARERDDTGLLGARINTSPLRKRRCENCAHFDAEEKECHKGPPAAAPMQQGGIAGIWAPTRATKFCGQHEPIPPEGLFESQGD